MKVLNLCCASISFAILRKIKDCGGIVHMHPAQKCAIELLLLEINQSNDTIEEKERLRNEWFPVTEHISDVYHPSQIVVIRDGHIILRVENLAIPTAYSELTVT